MPDVTAVYGTPLGFVMFFGAFSDIIENHSCLKCWIFTKLLQVVSLIDKNIFIYWSDVTVGYGRLSKYIFGNWPISGLAHYILIKISQIVYQVNIQYNIVTFLSTIYNCIGQEAGCVELKIKPFLSFMVTSVLFLEWHRNHNFVKFSGAFCELLEFILVFWYTC